MLIPVKLYIPDDMPLSELAEWAKSKGLQMSAKCAEDDTLLVYTLKPHKAHQQEIKTND